MKLAERVKKLSQIGLKEFLDLVKVTCPNATKEPNKKKVEIKMSAISKEEFAKILEFLNIQEKIEDNKRWRS